MARAGCSMSPSKSYTGNNYLPFQDLVKLDKVDDHTFRSTATPFSPGGAVGPNRAYGGHVYAQAAWAASQTVNDGFLLHVGICLSVAVQKETSFYTLNPSVCQY